MYCIQLLKHLYKIAITCSAQLGSLLRVIPPYFQVFCVCFCKVISSFKFGVIYQLGPFLSSHLFSSVFPVQAITSFYVGPYLTLPFLLLLFLTLPYFSTWEWVSSQVCPKNNFLSPLYTSFATAILISFSFE